MSTTNLFVELVVIGVGVLAWVALVVISVFGYSWIPTDTELLLGSAVPILAIVYVFGIIWDRLADYVFDQFWVEDLRSAFFADRATYYDARRIILTQSPALSELLEYGRSRLRICRGWSLNAIVIAIALNILIWTRFSDREDAIRLSVVGTFLFVALAIGSWLAWKRLESTGYRKIKDQSAFLADAAGRSASKELPAHSGESS